MPLIQNSIPNLINGVSQQAPSLRLATQAEEQINCYPTIVEGLRKRPPRKYVATLSSTFADSVFSHVIDRGSGERYALVIEDDDLHVFDLDTGDEKTVTFPDGKGYLDNLDPKNGFRATTVADYTFITNRGITPAMDNTNTAATRNHEVLIYIRAGDYDKEYRIDLNGTTVAKLRTPGGSHTDTNINAEANAAIHTNNIASILATGAAVTEADPFTSIMAGAELAHGNTYNDLDTHLPANFSYALYENVIHIWSTNGSDFSVECSDGSNGDKMYPVKDAVQTFSKLPDTGPEGFVIRIEGDEDNSEDHYFVKLEKSATGDTFGVWRECPEPGVVVGFDASTLPHRLVSNSDGTFTFEEIPYEDRVAGDEDIIPQPSFIGEPIRNITFFKNRLTFTSGENFVMSRSGDYYNFWRTTATALLDDDPIDASTNFNKVSIIEHAFPWKDALMLFSRQNQFALTGDKLFSPKTIAVDPLTDYHSSASVEPIKLGANVYFADDRGESSIIQEYFVVEPVSKTYEAVDTTGHVPQYVPSDIFKITGSEKNNVLIALSESERDAIYVYNFYFSDREKLQSAWHKWTIESGSKVLNAEVLDSELKLLTKYSNGDVALETMHLDPAQTDTGVSFVTHLDRRIDDSQLTTAVTTVSSPAYVVPTEITTFTLPYTATTIEAYKKDGTPLTVENHSGDTFEIRGDHSATELWVGIPYESEYQFSEFFIREEARGGGVTIKTEGRLQLRYLDIVYNDTSYFTVEVTPKGRDKYTYTFTGLVDGEPGTQTGSLPIADGIFPVPLLTNSRGITITVKNDSAFPSNLLSASWNAMWTPRARRAP